MIAYLRHYIERIIMNQIVNSFPVKVTDRKVMKIMKITKTLRFPFKTHLEVQEEKILVKALSRKLFLIKTI